MLLWCQTSALRLYNIMWGCHLWLLVITFHLWRSLNTWRRWYSLINSEATFIGSICHVDLGLLNDWIYTSSNWRWMMCRRAFFLRKIFIIICIVRLLMICSLNCEHRSSLYLLLLINLLLLLSYLLLFLGQCACISSTAHHCHICVTTLSHLWHVKVTVSLWRLRCRVPYQISRFLLRCWSSNSWTCWYSVLRNTTAHSIWGVIRWTCGCWSINL
jgi:hypothetical protein